MKLRKLSLAIGIATSMLAGSVFSLGLGEIKLNSALNEPLDAEIQLNNVGDLSEAQLLVDLASKSQFDKAGVDRAFFLTDLKFKVDLSKSGKPVIYVTSKKPIREPYLDFLVNVQWPSGKLLREYTLLLDLPTYASPKSKNRAPAVTAPSRAPSKSKWKPKPKAPVASGLTAGDQKYRVRSGDTAWHIASRTKPAGVSINKALVALQEFNPSAFINGNRNMLKRGAVLRLPKGADLAGLTTGAGTNGGSSTGSTTGQLAKSSTAPSANGQLKLAALDDSSVNGAGSEKALATVKEELDKTTRENADLKNRLKSLQEQVATMKRLVEIKDQSLAAAQQAAQKQMEDAEGEVKDAAEAVVAVVDGNDNTIPENATPETAELVKEDAPDTSNETPATGEADSEDLVIEGGGSEEAPASSSEPETSEPVVAQVEPAQPDPVPASVPSSPSVSDDQSNEDGGNPIIGLWNQWKDVLLYPLIGLAGLLVAAAMFFRKKEGDEDVAIDESSSHTLAEDNEPVLKDDEDVLLTEETQVEEAPLLSEDSTTAEDIAEDLDDGIDPLGKADIYLSLGNHDEAEQLLTTAIVRAPEDPELRLKLLEVYVSDNNTEGFTKERLALAELGDTNANTIANAMGVELNLPPLASSDVAASGDDLQEQLEDALDLELDDVSADAQATEPDDSLEDIILDFEETAEELTLDTPETSPENAAEDTSNAGLVAAAGGAVAAAGAAVADALTGEDDNKTDQPADDLADIDLDVDLSAELDDALGEVDELEASTVELEESTGELDVELDSAVPEITEAEEIEADLSELAELEAELEDVGDITLETEGDADLDVDTADLAAELDVIETSVDADFSLETEEDSHAVDASEVPSDTAGMEPATEVAGTDNEVSSSFDAEDMTTAGLTADIDDIDLDQLSADIDMELDSIDLDDADLELPDLETVSTDTAEVAEAPADEAPVAETAPKQEDDVDNMLGGEDECSTRLELAEAYIDMGEKTSARSILDEVITDGNDSQKQKARELLDGLS